MNILAYLTENNRFVGIIGIACILLVAFACSKHKRKIPVRTVINALIMQFVLAFLILKTDVGRGIFESIAAGFSKLYSFADSGSQFLFGKLADVSGPWGVVFAIKVIPIIIFFGALMSLLFHLGVVQLIVKGVSFLIRPILGTSGAETLCAAANSMLGQTESPLFVRHYLKGMTESEMLVVMVSGMATLSGAILAVYGAMGVPMLHLLSSSVIAIPGAVLISKILLPEVGTPETMGGRTVKLEKDTTNILDAISKGTTDGLSLAVNVAAMLIAFISIMSLINFLLVSTIHYSLDEIFAKLFAYVAYLLGVSWQDKEMAGMMLGQKLVINEFIAYATFVKAELATRSHTIMTYALAGFANFSSIGIQIGGIGALAPEKRTMLTKLGLTALLGGTLTNFLNAAIAGLFV